MRGDPIPNDDNVLRYARPNLVDGDDVDGGAFQKRVRDDEADPSHALICGTPDPTTDSELAETVGDMIAACVTALHLAIIEQA